MSRQEKVTRMLWCEHCDAPQHHEIEYKGTHMRKDVPHVKFDSECLRCKDRHALHIIKEHFKVTHVIPATDYNSLIRQEIYAGSFMFPEDSGSHATGSR